MTEEMENLGQQSETEPAESTATTKKTRTPRQIEGIRMGKFVMFSISAGIIEAVVFTLMNELLNLPYWPCYLTALVCSVVWNFTWNRAFTFRSATNVPVAMLKVFAYYCVFTPLTTIGGNFLEETLGWNEYLVTAINMALNLSTEYLYQRFVVFGKSLDTRQSKAKAKQ